MNKRRPPGRGANANTNSPQISSSARQVDDTLRAAALRRARIEFPNARAAVAEIVATRRGHFALRREGGVDVEAVARAVGAIDRLSHGRAA